jgi:hypothetical protein
MGRLRLKLVRRAGRGRAVGCARRAATGHHCRQGPRQEEPRARCLDPHEQYDLHGSPTVPWSEAGTYDGSPARSLKKISRSSGSPMRSPARRASPA